MTHLQDSLFSVVPPKAPMIHLRNASFNADTRQKIEEGFLRLEKIKKVQIYFSDDDAVMDGYYYLNDKRTHGRLESLSSPSMVLTDEDGDQMWIHCAKCGYGGSGPNSAKRILRMLPNEGFNQVPALSEDQLEAINEYRVVSFERIGNEWVSSLQDSRFEPQMRLNREFKAPPQATLYRYENRFVMLQGQENPYSEQEDNGIAKRTLKEYTHFIPHPVAFTFYNDPELAIERGHICPDTVHSNQAGIYPLIIQDKSGRQLWLQPYVERDQPFEHQDTVKDLLASVGFDLSSYEKQVKPINFLSFLMPRKEQEQERVIKGQMNIQS